MDINCTHDCLYQQDGKCTLKELPLQQEVNNISNEIDCLYYSALQSMV